MGASIWLSSSCPNILGSDAVSWASPPEGKNINRTSNHIYDRKSNRFITYLSLVFFNMDAVNPEI
jgi:hypothetical protein